MKTKQYFLFTFIAFILSNPLLWCITEIPEGPVQGTWTIENSPYYILGNIHVPDGGTLIIEPGVDVLFMGHYWLDVKGQLLAIGKDSGRIRFTAQNKAEGWHGIRMNDISIENDSSKLVFCELSYGYHKQFTPGGKAAGVLTIGSDKVIVNKCIFFKNTLRGNKGYFGGAMAIRNCSPIISQNLFFRNKAIGAHGGAVGIYEANPEFENNILFENEAFGGGGLMVQKCNPILMSNTILRNTAEHAGGVDIIFCEPIFINSIIYDNYGTLEADNIHLAFNNGASFIHTIVEDGIDGFWINHDPDFQLSWLRGIYDHFYSEDSTLLAMGKEDDFYLDVNSICRKAGTTKYIARGDTLIAPRVDFHNNIRYEEGDTLIDLGAVQLEETVSVFDIFSDSYEFSIYPNPAKKYLMILGPEGVDFQGAQLQLFTLDGKIIFSKEITNAQNNKVEIDLPEFYSNIYYLKVTTKDKKLTSPLVIIKE